MKPRGARGLTGKGKSGFHESGEKKQKKKKSIGNTNYTNGQLPFVVPAKAGIHFRTKSYAYMVSKIATAIQEFGKEQCRCTRMCRKEEKEIATRIQDFERGTG